MAKNQLYANSQLMYYPTSPLETYRMLGLIGEIKLYSPRYSTGNYGKKLLLEEVKDEIGEEAYLKIGAEALDNDVEIDVALYDYFIRTEQYDYIKKYFIYHIKPNNKTITIADLQAGEGEWLNTFKDFIPYYYNEGRGNNHIKTIANELEEERYKNIKADYQYLGSFEELQLPKESISLLLFNPPYGETNGERNVRRYFRMTMKREIMCRSSYILMVIREDDARDIVDIFNRYFSALTIYKTHQEEYDKYKQVVILGRKWMYPLDENTKMGAYDIQMGIKTYLEKLDNVTEFQLKHYNSRIELSEVKIEQVMESFEYVIDNKAVVSDRDSSVWKQIKDLTELADMGKERIVLPKPPKQGEIANLLASGQINGAMEIEENGNKYSHIVVGGVKHIEDEEIIEKDGFTETKTIRYSKPYLNILVSEDGKYKIKELGVDTH